MFGLLLPTPYTLLSGKLQKVTVCLGNSHQLQSLRRLFVYLLFARRVSEVFHAVNDVSLTG